MKKATQPSLEGCDIRIRVVSKSSHLRRSTVWSARLSGVCRLSSQGKKKDHFL